MANVDPEPLADTVEAFKAKGTFLEAYASGTKNFQPGATRGKTIVNLDEEATEGGSLTVASASFNLANNIIGAGLVGMSNVVASSGLAPFSIFISLAGFALVWTLDLLEASGVMAGIKDFDAVATKAIGKVGKGFTAFAVWSQCYGGCIAYLVLVGNSAEVFNIGLDAVIGVRVAPTTLQIVITLVVVLPLTFLKDLNALSSSAMYALVVYAAVGITIAYSPFGTDWYATTGLTDGVAAQDDPNDVVFACESGDVAWFAANVVELFQNFPTIIFAYVCHPAALPMFEELKDSRLPTMKKVNRISIAVAGTLYTVVGIAGYWSSRSNTMSSALLNTRHCVCEQFAGDQCNSRCESFRCADDSVWATILNVNFLLAVVTGYPSVHYALRRTLISAIWGQDAEFSWPVHCGVAVVNVLGTLAIAVAAGDVSVVFNWAGAIAAPMVAFVLPSWCFLSLLKDMPRFPEDPSLNRPMGQVLLVSGLVFMVGGVSLQLYDIFG